MTKPGDNTLEGRALKFLKRIETLLAEGESAKGTYMAECRERRADLKTIYIEAKDNDISVRALKALVKQRGLQKQIDDLAAGLEENDAEQFETLAAAFGDTPMGQYAATRAGKAGGDDDGRDLRPRNLKENDKSRESDPDALAKVGRGPDAVDSLAKH